MEILLQIANLVATIVTVTLSIRSDRRQTEEHNRNRENRTTEL